MPDPRIEAMRSRGDEHERAYIGVRYTASSIVHLRESRDPQATLAAMHQGVVIVQAPLGNDHFFGIADVLVRVEIRSALGAYSYEQDTRSLGGWVLEDLGRRHRQKLV